MTRLGFVLIAVICVIIMSDGVIFAQDTPANGGTLRGLINDVTPAQNPIEGVEVKIVAQDGGEEYLTKTDGDGNYKHAGLPAGRYLISIFKDGYDKRLGKPVTIVEDGDHFVPLKMAQKGNIKPFFEVQQERKHIAIKQEIKPRVESLLQGIAESVSRRYDLDPATADTLRWSILESVEIALKRDGNIHVFAKSVEGGSEGLLKVLLSRLDCKVLFTEHLNEAQLQDYLEFTEARRQRDQQAVARRITVALDKELSLTAAQREKVVQSLLDTTENEAFPTAMHILGIGSQEAVHLAHYRLKISLESILTEAQSIVWRGFVNAEANAEDVAIAKLIAHTELLGPLDERAARRLALAARGTVQQYFEARDERRERVLQRFEAKFRKRVEAGEMTLEQAAGGLQVIRKDLWDEDRTNRQRAEKSASGITKDRLYQQAIKDVLSEEAFAKYTAHRVEREALRLQALRDIAVAGMDTQLLLDDPQRKQLETAASHLAPVRYAGSKPAEFMFFELFRRATNFEILTSWQQREFERVFAPIIWGK